MFIVNKMFIADEIYSIESSDKSIKKYGKLSKTRRLSKNLKFFKSKKLKGEKLFESIKLFKSKNSKGEKLSNSQKLAK